jgi:hypothetical protein
MGAYIRAMEPSCGSRKLGVKRFNAKIYVSASMETARKAPRVFRRLQRDYGVFSVSPSQIDALLVYVKN